MGYGDGITGDRTHAGVPLGGAPPPLLWPGTEFDVEQLAGGIANLGRVARIGDTVRRPASAYTDGRRYMLTMVG
jgi:hypothetical protein